jgi:hypothetical protein
MAPKLYEVLSPLKFEYGSGKDERGRNIPTSGPIRQPGEKVDLAEELEPEEIEQLVNAGVVKEVPAAAVEEPKA